MSDFVIYQRRAEQCASLRDQAGTDFARARLARECADWLELAQKAGRPAWGREPALPRSRH
jgi:hypothetical protein